MLLRSFLSALLLFCIAVEPLAAATMDSSVQERQLFRQTRDQLQRQQFTKAKPGVAALKRYPLAPYLELPLLQARLGDLPYDDVDDFFKRFPDSISGDSLRGSWLGALAQNQRWKDVLAYYDPATATKGSQCLRLEALYQTGDGALALNDTAVLWLSPIDLPTACDAPFERWLAAEPALRVTRIWERLILALSQNQDSLAQHLAQRLDGNDRVEADLALQVYRNPQTTESQLSVLRKQPHGSAVLGIGLRKLAKIDVDKAMELWKEWSKKEWLKAGDSFAARNEIGRQLIGSRGTDALPWLIAADPQGTDPYLLEWRVRLGLSGGDWPTIASWIALMPKELGDTPRWRYWYARSLGTSDDPAQTAVANEIYQSLATDRSFYGFLAADHTALPYKLNHQPLKPGVSLAQVAKRGDMRRAREFYLLDEKGAARREWQRALKSMSPDEQQASTLLAKDWGWTDQALRLAQITGGFDDLDLRFPTAYRSTMTSAAKSRGLQTEWLFAIARQESAFMADARSPVGATGLLQLMPATAKQVAKSLGMPKFDPKQLVQPERNIPLGSKYLSDLLVRYNGNRVLATAAYNAGPGRVSRLLAQQTHPVSMDIWVETFPIRETREYIQSVLTFAVIYSERLGLPKTALVNTEERVIGEPIVMSQAEEVTTDPVPAPVAPN
jgi:soluble lytic murein transglycosylase